MPILYHPTASYQYYIAPGSSSVSITAAIFNVGGVTLDNETTAASVEQPAGGDFNVARFAVPSGLVTTDATIDIDYVAENVNPAEYLTSAPAITHQPAGVTYMGTKTFLTFPNSTETSSFVYRANVSLPMGGSTLELRRNSSDTQYVRVTRKSALDTMTVTNDAGFASALDGAYSGDGVTLDVIYVNYNARMNDVWALQSMGGNQTSTTARDTYLTIAPTGGNEIVWSMNNDVATEPRTSNTFIRYKNINVGGSTDDWSSGNYYSEKYSHILFDGCTFESKYNVIDYGYVKRPNGIRVTILGSSADLTGLVPGEYFYQGEGGQSGHSADTESTNFGYVGVSNNVNVYEYGTSAGVSFASFNVYGILDDTGVSGSFIAGATVNVAYNPVLNKGNSTAAPRGFTLESYVGVSGSNMPLAPDGKSLITIKNPVRLWTQIAGFLGFSGCNFISTPGPVNTYATLVKDCFYNGHRGDIVTSVGCGINNRAINIAIRREWNDYYGAQTTHVDLHQWVGSSIDQPDNFHENFYYGGHLVENGEGNTYTSLQHSLFERGISSDNRDIFMRKSICRYKTDEDQNFIQLAGNFTNVGLNDIECVGVPNTPGEGVVSYRMAYNDQRDGNPPVGVSLENFYINGCTASRFEVSFSSISGLPNINVKASTVTDISDVSSYLNGLTTEGFGYGITFSNCSVTPAPQYGTFAADTTNQIYRTNSGTGNVFVNTFVDRGTQLAAGLTGSGINSFTMYPDKLFIGFSSETERNAFNTRNPKMTITIIADDGTPYNYAWDSVGSSPNWGTLSTALFPADETIGTTWDSNWTDLYARFGDNPQYDMRETEAITPAGSLTSLQLLIDNTPVGGTLDLNGGVYSMMGSTQAASLGFTADYNDTTGVVWTGFNIEESITIENGTISISELHRPTDRGDGTFSVPNTTNESLIQMFDPDSSQELIRLATYPPQYDNRVSTFFVDANSFDLNSVRGATVGGGPITDKQIDSSKPLNGILTQNLIDGKYYTSGFTVIGATLVNDIKTMLDSVVTNESAYSGRTAAATNIGMIININPNQIYPQVVSEYSEGTSGGDDILGITFAGGTAEWFSRSADNQYIREFNFFGRVSFGLTGASGAYYTYGDDEIIYKPLSGKCDNIYLPHLAADQYNPLGQYGGFVLRNNGNRSDIRFNNCTTIGGGAYRGTHSGKHFYDVRAQGGELTSSLILRGHTSYIGTSIYSGGNGATFDVQDCRFIGPATNGIGGAGGDSFFINRCEFRGGFYKSSAISKTNSTMLPPSIGKLQPTRVTNCVFDFDSNHGQAISAYASTYINTEISGNVFVNTPRPVSAQWGLVDASLVHDLSSYGGFTFSNNLHYMHQLPAQNATGQSGIAFNGDVPRTVSLELSSLLPGSPTGDGFYGITAGDSKYNLTGYCVELTNGDLPRVKIQLLGRGYRVRGGTGYILGNIDRWDLVDTQENYFNSRFEIDGRSGPSGNLLNGDIIIHEISGGTVGDVVVSGITCENTLLVENIPDTYIENNTVMLSRDIITEEPDGLLTQNVQNCLNLQFGGGSSGVRRNISTIGAQKTRNNIILGHQGTNATRRAGRTGGYDTATGITLNATVNGVYSLNDNIVSLGEGENKVTGNTFLLFGGQSEGFVDDYIGPLGNQRKNFLSKSLGTTIDAYYNSDGRIGTTAQQAEAFDQVFTWNNGDATIEPKSGYSGGCYWSSYPTWNEIDSLGYTFSTIYTPF